MTESYPIKSLQAGKTKPLGKTGDTSAIGKAPLRGPQAIGYLGIAGDEQADKVHHGGPEMALHHYPLDHYDYWRRALNEHPLLDWPGAFGENVSTLGLTEETACIGDRYRLGTALVEISKGRQPCWKLAQHFEYSKLVKLVTQTRRSGWYLRVLEEGEAAPDEWLTLVERPYPEWSVARVFGLLVGGDHADEPEALATLADLPVLSPDWRERARELGR